MIDSIKESVEENDIRLIRLTFVDIAGTAYAISIPVQMLERAFTRGVGIDSSSIPHFSRINRSDMRIIPDPASFKIMALEQSEGIVMCNIVYPDGREYEKCTRSLLQTAVAFQEAVYLLKPEIEFFLTKDGAPIDAFTYLSAATDLQGYRVLDELVVLLERAGIQVEKFHHENGKGQYEVELVPKDAVTAADSIIFFKEIARQLCRKYDLEISFLPKPFREEAGSGMHFHQELRKNGENLFFNGELTELGKRFITGQIDHIAGLTRILNPVGNSYQRFLGGQEAPRYVCWGYSNRSALIRIPPSGRIEIRSPDPTCNPYLTFFFLLKAGLSGDGELPDPIEENVYTYDAALLRQKGIKELPASLKDAEKEFKKDPLLIKYAYLFE